MTTTRNFVINTRWGHANQTTSKLHRHPKRLNPTENYLFDLLTQYLLKEIDFLASGLEHHEKLKAVITEINPLCNPILFAIPQELCVPYYNFSVYIIFIMSVITHGHIGVFQLTRVRATNIYSQVILRLLEC